MLEPTTSFGGAISFYLRSAAAIVFLAALALPTQSLAATFPVTKAADTVDGSCSPADCSLREAVIAANAANDADTVTLPAGTYVLSLGAQLLVTSDLSVSGAGASGTIIDGNQTSRIFQVGNDATVFSVSGVTLQRGRDANGSAIESTGTQITLDGVTVSANTSPAGGTGFGVVKLASTGTETLTIRNSAFSNNVVGGGNQVGFGGAVVANPGPAGNTVSINVDHSTFSSAHLGGGGASGTGFGGAFSSDISGGGNRVALSLSNSTISGSSVGSEGSSGHGGAMFIETVGATDTASVAISQSTISGNTAATGSGNGFGGAIRLEELGGDITLNMVNSTISGNTAANGSGNGFGGAISASGTGSRTILNSTIAGNTAAAGSGSGFGGGIQGAGTVTLKNSIVADNIAAGSLSNCDAAPISQGHNIENVDTCAFAAAGDLKNTDPQLGPLTDNGGATQTRALPAGSPAINAGTNDGCPTVDQRGGSRPQPVGGACDAGAFEFGALADLAVKLSASPAELGQGDKLTYKITASNDGPDQAAGVKVVESLAAGMKVTSLKTSQGSCAKTVVDCSLGTLAKGASATVDVTVTPSRIETASATATISGDPADPIPANNTAKVTTKVRLGLTDLSISPRSVKPATTLALISKRRGATVRYRLFEKAKVKFTIERPRRGHLVNGKCKAGKGKGKSKRCTIYKRVKGSFGAKGKKGLNRKRFSGRLRGKRLGRGKYRLVAVARSGKNTSLTKQVQFKIAR